MILKAIQAFGVFDNQFGDKMKQIHRTKERKLPPEETGVWWGKRHQRTKEEKTERLFERLLKTNRILDWPDNGDGAKSRKLNPTNNSANYLNFPFEQ